MSLSNNRPPNAQASGSANAAGPSKPPPLKPPVVQPGSGKNIIINPNQRLNPVLECIRNVGKEFGDIVVDFQVGKTTGVLFLSLRYHRLHPEYIHKRIELLGHSYNLRILLLLCDITEHQEHIRELTKICIINNITIIVAWSPDEAGQYLATFKQFEHKPPDLIRERVEREPAAMLRNSLTSISKVNKTDVETLRTSFGSFANIARATSDQLSQLPGFGPKKVARMKEAFEKPFRNSATSALDFPSPSSQSALQRQTQVQHGVTGASPGKGKGKEKETDAASVTRPPVVIPSSSSTSSANHSSTAARRREPSPAWDIELDLNSPSPSPPLPLRVTSPRSTPAVGQKRAASPVWDIELDLNGSDIEMDEGDARESKRRKGCHES